MLGESWRWLALAAAAVILGAGRLFESATNRVARDVLLVRAGISNTGGINRPVVLGGGGKESLRGVVGGGFEDKGVELRALGPIGPHDKIPGLFYRDGPGSKAVYVTDVVVNKAQKRTTVITINPGTLRSDDKGEEECNRDKNLTFPSVDLEPEGFAVWVVGVDDYECVSVVTQSFDPNINGCIHITHCNGANFGPTRGSLGARSDPSLGVVPSAGFGRPNAKNKGGVSVAIAGIHSVPAPAMPKIAETLAFYDLMQYSHVYFGVNVKPGDPLLRELSVYLSRYIESGLLSIHPCGVSDLYQKKAKIPFLNAVLYNVKGLDDWLGVWDADELMIPRAIPRPLPVSTIVSDLVGVRRDVCFIIFRAVSLTLCDNRDGVYNGKMYHTRLRDFGGKAAYEKSMTNVSRSMFQGLHFPGACSLDNWITPPRKPNIPNDFLKVENQTVAGINHYCNMFVGRYGNDKSAPRAVDEFSSVFYPLLDIDRSLIGNFTEIKKC